MDTKLKYISSSIKIIRHPDRIVSLRHGISKPITLECALTDSCQLECVYCSVRKRPLNKIDIDVLFNLIKDLMASGLKSIVLTGGGEPILFPQINEVIDFSKKLGLEIGLITNGITLNRVKNLQLLTWVRVSLNLDQELGSQLVVPDIPENVTLGFSLVTNGDKLKFNEAVEFYRNHKPDATYLRVVGDCTDSLVIAGDLKETISQMVNELNDPSIFFSHKMPQSPKQCLLGYLKPFVYTDGYIYPCSSCVLEELKFPEQFRICHATEFIGFLERKVISSLVSTTCDFCVLTEQNDFLGTCLENSPHENFI